MDKANHTAGTSRPGITYRAEYRYHDGEIAHEKEGDDEANLLLDRFTPIVAPPPITITTVYTSTTTKERSKKKKKDISADTMDDKSKDTTKDKEEVSDEKEEHKLLEDFANSHVSTKCMTIHSKKLLNALRDVVNYYPGSTLLGDEISIYEPYQLLCHHRKDLRAYKDSQPEWHDEVYRKECNEHLDILLGFLDIQYGKVFQEEEARWARSTPVCTFQYLWLLFKPGETCYSLDDDDEINPYVTEEVMPYGGFIGGKAIKYQIAAWNIDFDGYQMGRCRYYLSIRPFDGEKEIKSLKYYPTEYYTESQEGIKKHGGKNFNQRLVARGRKFWDLARKGNCYQEYSGESAEYPHEKRSDRGTNEKCPLILDDGNDNDDEESEASKSLGCQCQFCTPHPSKVRRDRFEGFSGLYPDEEEPPKDEKFFFLCNQRVFGFILKTRIWESLRVKHIGDVAAQKNAFHHLVLPDEVKYTLQAISCSYVKAQEVSRTHNTDIVKGKGEGKIFLLHGPPGTGKTLSAEVVAELTSRPLLSLTCGDLGTTAGEVEERLGRYMNLGQNWGAVVLLDEADIYLEARAINEVKRNSLVSVFLRALEYYTGLLFLTTNRVSTFDEAFKSRIHVALEYKRLTDDDRRVIWKNNMDNMLSEKVQVTETAREYVYSDKHVISLEWNGREIRNALQTAMSLAEFDAEDKGKDIVKINSKHLKRIVVLSASFQKYIASMHRNKSDSYVAKQNKLRNDFYTDSPSKPVQRNTIGKSKYLIPMNDEEEPPRVRTKARDVRGVEYEEDDDPRPRSRRSSIRKNNRAVSEDDEVKPRSRSKQPEQKSRHIAPIEEESEDEVPKSKKSSRRAPRPEEEESEEAEIPKARKMANTSAREASLDQDKEDEELPNITKQSRKLTKAIPVHEDEEEEEGQPRSRTTKSTKRAASIIREDERYARTESQSPARTKKGIARKVKPVSSESEEE